MEEKLCNCSLSKLGSGRVDIFVLRWGARDEFFSVLYVLHAHRSAHSTSLNLVVLLSVVYTAGLREFVNQVSGTPS